MPENREIEYDSAQVQETPERFGRNGFVIAGGVIGLTLALVFLCFASPRKATARPSRKETVSERIVQTPVLSTPKAEGSNSGSASTPATGSIARPEPHAEISASTSSPEPLAQSAPTDSPPTLISDSKTSSSSYGPPPTASGFPRESALCGYPLGDGTTCRNRVSGGGYCYLHSDSPSPAYSPLYSGGGTVHVRGYYRKDGTYVRPHARSAPRRR